MPIRFFNMSFDRKLCSQETELKSNCKNFADLKKLDTSHLAQPR